MKASSRSVGTNTERSSTRSASTQTTKTLDENYLVEHDESSNNNRQTTKRKSRSQGRKKEMPKKAAKFSHNNPNEELDTDISMSTINERSRMNDSINNNTTNEMDEITNKPTTSKAAAARAQSAPFRNGSSMKKRNQSSPSAQNELSSSMHSTPSTTNRSNLPQKRSVQVSIDEKKSKLKNSSKVSRHPDDSARLRFQFSDLSDLENTTIAPRVRPLLDLSSSGGSAGYISSSSSHASPRNNANQTDVSISEGMNRLVVKTPRVVNHRNQSHTHMDVADMNEPVNESMNHSIELNDTMANHYNRSFENNASLDLTNLARLNETPARPHLRRSERIRLNNERRRILAENEPIIVNLRHVTLRRNNQGFGHQQQVIKNARKTKRA